MEIEAELPENFDSLPNDEKIGELEELRQNFSGDSDADLIKRRMIEELIREYRSSS